MTTANIDALLDQLRDREDYVRWSAALAVGQIGPDVRAVVPALIELLHDLDNEVCWRAVVALGEIGPDAHAAAPVLVELLRDPDNEVRRSAAYALGKIGPDAHTVVPTLIVMLHDPEDEVRENAAFVLGEIGPDAHAAVPVLIEMLHDPEDFLRRSAAYALGKIGPDARAAVTALFELLRDSEDEVRRSAAYALSKITAEMPSVYRGAEIRDRSDRINKLESSREIIYDFEYECPPNDDRDVIEEPPQPPPPDATEQEANTPAAALRSLARNLSNDVDKRAAKLAEYHLAYRQELAALYEPLVNARIYTAVGNSLDDKKRIVKALNETLRHSGLAIHCEVEDKNESSTNATKVYAGTLVADTSRRTDKVGRFRFEYHDEANNPKRQAIPSEADGIKLMASPVVDARELSSGPPQTFVGRFGQASQTGVTSPN